MADIRETIRQGFIDGTYTFVGPTLTIDPKVFKEPNSAQHTQVVAASFENHVPIAIRPFAELEKVGPPQLVR
ncbi:MAG: hypothetical protein M3N08_10840 [Pseudomonadota bacterium]|nr:hypothetical protein [Pseudomonadota bacterium]